MRRPYAVALVLLALAAPAASAKAPRVWCHLVTDPAGDDGVLPNHAVSRGEVDLLSGDLATNATTLTAVVRVTALPAPDTGHGTYYTVTFYVGEARFVAEAQDFWDGSSSVVQVTQVDRTLPVQIETGQAIGIPSLVLDRAHHEVRMSMPLALLRTYAAIKPGTGVRLSGIDSGAMLGSATKVQTYSAAMGLEWQDTARNGGTYPAGAPSCVKVGR